MYRVRTAALHAAVILAAGALCVARGAAPAALPTPPAAPSPHPDTAFAHELFHLKQASLMEAQQKESMGAPAENLWKAELILLRYDELTKDSAQQATVIADYLSALQDYLGKEKQPIDGAWALDHARFILTRIGQPIVTRMEYWGGTDADRAALAPPANLAGELLARGGATLAQALKTLEAATPFDDKTYGADYSVAAEVRYYTAWADYFRAMALPADQQQRNGLLTDAAGLLGEWAVEGSDNGVNFQAYLLRGKVNAQLGKIPAALADFTQAQADKAPEGIGFQARYQTILANLKSQQLLQAADNLDALNRWIPKGNAEADETARMLEFRVAWATAQSDGDVAGRYRGEKEAIEALKDVAALDPRFRGVAYQEIAATIPENTALDHLLPMQQLAVAYEQSVGQRGDSAPSRAHLTRALAAAQAAAANDDADISDKIEATFLAGASDALLGNLLDAAKYNVAFAGMAPKDPRAHQVVDLALAQIGELRNAAGAPASAPATQGGGNPDSELNALATHALNLATQTFGDKQWLYAQGRTLEDAGKPAEAAAVYEKISAEDPNYLDARYRLVTLAAEQFGQLEGKGTDAQQRQAAAALFAACSQFSELLDHPPAAAPKELLAAARANRFNIWLVEIAAALSPAVKKPDIALDRLDKLDQSQNQLTAAQRQTLLRDRIEALQMAGEPEKAQQAVADYVQTGGKDAIAALEAMALSASDQIDAAEARDPAQARRLAAFVAELLAPVSQQEDAEGKKDQAFEYRVIEADMLVRAGQFADAEKLADDLQHERGEDIRGFMAQARAIFGEAQAKNDRAKFAEAQDYFTRILARLSPGGEGFWEAWLRIVQSMQAQNGDPAQIKTRLGDLKGVYGDTFGGQKYKADFAKLAQKYGV